MHHKLVQKLTYEKIIEKGRALKPFPSDLMTPENRVVGCQSRTYLIATLKEGKVYYQMTSDALISKGLAAILLSVYDGQSPAMILTHKPTFLEEMGITSALSPNRANGLYSMHLRMQQEALKLAASESP